MTGAPRPTGTVVFLFSDIEGSTQRWDAYGDAMRDALRRHDEIVRGEIERRRGYVFKTIGDAFCAAFWTPREGLEAAVETQRRLAAEDFSAVDGVAVRMAIHAGETDERSGDYFGTAVNRTARLLAAGRGGQILISGYVADLIKPQLPSGITLRRLGTLPLRDLKEPEQVYQPLATGLRTTFGALRALQTPPSNLPRQTTSLVGRDGDVADVAKLLTGGALVTIVGAGGMGKTRLALEAASATINDRRDGAWFVDLSSIQDPDLIVGEILSELRVKQSAEPLKTLLRYLEKRELLLVLDNCEHVLGEAARVVAAVLAHCRLVTVLATSREALDVGGERVYRLSSLKLDSAIQLFIDRARAADAKFSESADAVAVATICRSLDGIALGIELAAARVRTIPLQKLSRHLGLRMLAGGRDRRPRQQTMRALIDWSYALLGETERLFLRRCAVFSGGFLLEAASGVCVTDDSDELDALETVASLVDKSLLVSEAAGAERRYRLLEPIRQYAAERLDESGETLETQRRHAVTYAAIAHGGYEEWETGPTPDWLFRFEAELANFRAAFAWTVERANDPQLGAAIAADTMPVFLRLSLLGEGIEWSEGALQVADLPRSAEARLRYGLAMLYGNQGMNDRVLGQALSAAALFRELGNPRGLARALSRAASCYAAESSGEAKTAAQEAVRLASALGDRRLLADVLRRCASAFAVEGADRVRATYAHSVELFRSLGRDDEIALALTWWGQWEESIENCSGAVERLVEAKQLAGKDAVLGIATEIVACYLALGDRANAKLNAREALELAVKARHPISTPLAMTYVAALADERDALEAARLMGYVRERFRVTGWELVAYDRKIVASFMELLERRLGQAELSRLLAEGAGWTEDDALVRAIALSSRI